MLFYAIGIFGVGVGLSTGWLHDEFSYAVIVVGMNYLQVDRAILVKSGYHTRGEIKRLLFLDKRIALLQGNH